MERTHLVVMLAGGIYSSIYFKTRQEASDWIKGWAAEAEVNLGKEPPQYTTNMMTHHDAEGNIGAAYVRQCIIGMYIAEDKSSVNDRLAAAQEKIAEAVGKQVGQGDEWKD